MRLTDHRKTHENFGIPSTSGLNADHSSSESNLHHVSSVEIGSFRKQEVRRHRRQKTKQNVLLTDAAVKENASVV
jgi:hypothetical protein